MMDVAYWMIGNVFHTIDNADRRPHIETIKAEFSFYVYKNSVDTSSYSNYDFATRRCAELKSPLQQTAVAMAIANAVRSGILMKYRKDQCGTEYSLHISKEYSDYHHRYDNAAKNVIVKIVYEAKNSNYQPVRKW